MELDVKKIISQVIEKVSGNEDLLEKFKKNPIEAVKSVVGVELTDDVLNSVVEAVKAKLLVDQGGDLLGKLGGFLGKK